MKTFRFKKIDILFYLDKKLTPKNFSLEKFKIMINEYKIYKRIICMPDLHFKDKNFIPSGVNVPIKNTINPLLLSSSNNDSIGSLHIKSDKELSKKEIKKIFLSLKKNISIFRRKKNIISSKCFLEILQNGIKNIYKKWGFKKEDIDHIEKKGSENLEVSAKELLKIIRGKKITSLPKFVPSDGIDKRGPKNIGVIDGTGHWIELFKVKRIVKKIECDHLDVKKGDYFFLIHSGSADIGKYFHHFILDQNKNNINPSTKPGKIIKSFYLAASNYGFANRLFIYKKIKEILKKKLNINFVKIFSDLPHDYLDIDKKNKIFFHKKGVVKILPKSKCKNINLWKHTGAPYIMPSHPGGDAFLMTNKGGNNKSFFTLNHGVGRMISKDNAGKRFIKFKLSKNTSKTFQLFRYGKDKIETQNPRAFKDHNHILKIIEKNNLAERIASFESIASLKA